MVHRTAQKAIAGVAMGIPLMSGIVAPAAAAGAKLNGTSACMQLRLWVSKCKMSKKYSTGFMFELLKL